jgi:hypothetical protein
LKRQIGSDSYDNINIPQIILDLKKCLTWSSPHVISIKYHTHSQQWSHTGTFAPQHQRNPVERFPPNYRRQRLVHFGTTHIPNPASQNEQLEENSAPAKDPTVQAIVGPLLALQALDQKDISLSVATNIAYWKLGEAYGAFVEVYIFADCGLWKEADTLLRARSLFPMPIETREVCRKPCLTFPAMSKISKHPSGRFEIDGPM